MNEYERQILSIYRPLLAAYKGMSIFDQPNIRRLREGRQMIITKPWGSENIFIASDRFIGKVLTINPGQRTSLQYHRQKNEAIYVARGYLTVTSSEGSHERELLGFGKPFVLSPGKSLIIPPRTLHRFEAPEYEDVILFESSSPELDDVVRVEDDYGRECEG